MFGTGLPGLLPYAFFGHNALIVLAAFLGILVLTSFTLTRVLKLLIK